MKRALVLAAAGLCVAAGAHAQSSSNKFDWDDNANRTCMEPYAPAIPKAEESTLKELVKEVKPEVKTFIDESNRYLECLGVQMARAKEEGDKERLKKLIKAHNDNVEYQQSVAGEFNATLNKLKEEAGLAVAQPEGAGQKGVPGGGSEAESPGNAGDSQTSETSEDSADAGAPSESGGETAADKEAENKKKGSSEN